MELPYCKNWCRELLDEGHGPLGLQEAIARAGFRVEVVTTMELTAPGRPDLVVQAYVGYHLGMRVRERYAVERADWSTGSTVEDTALTAVENAMMQLFNAYSASCELCANGEHKQSGA